MCQNLQSLSKLARKALILLSFITFWSLKTDAQCTCSGNMVLNPSFESGTTNWGWSGGNLSAGGGAVKCGSYSGDFQITNASSNWVSQEIFPASYQQGGQINVSVWAGTHDNSYSNYVTVDFFDASWNWQSSSSQQVDKVLANSPAGPQLYSWSATIPSGIGHITVGFGGSGSWTKTDMWCVSFTPNTSCNNVTDGGTIGSDENLCTSPYNPSLITNVTSPTGGSGTLQYIWLYSYDGGTTNTVISGATSSTYDPPAITQTTWYRRCARRSGCTDYNGESNWIKKEVGGCCTATINGLQFKDPTGVNTTLVPVSNGGTYNIPNLPTPFNLEALLTGNMESVRFTLTGSATGGNVENAFPWDYAGSGSTWPHGAGTFTVLIEAFPLDNAAGQLCASASFTFTLTNVTCSNVTNAGTIGYDETICATSFDPALIQNLTAPSGGSGTLEYIWLSSLDGGTTNSVIAGATSSSYDPPTITQTTWYRRCARRSGCSDYVGETSWIKKELTYCAPTLSCPASSFTWSQTINPTNGSQSIVKLISGSVNTYTISTGFPAAMTTGPVTLYVANVVSYDGYSTRNTVTQVNERWRLLFKKSGTTIYTSPYTNDLQDLVKQASWTGSLGTTFVAPNGIDQIVIEHYDVANGYVGPGSVIPVGICIEYQNCPTANAGAPITLTCTTPSGTIGSAAVSGLTYAWSPSAGLSAANIAQPTANPAATTTYTVTVTNAYNCTATSAVTVTVNKTLPTANAGPAQTTTCTTTSVTIGTASVSGNSYSWSPSAGLSATNVAQPVANPTATTTYTVTVTGSNGCTATSAVTVTVNKTPPTADAGADKNLNCTTTSTIIGTAAVAGNSYSWSPSTGLSATNIAQPTANPTATTTYTVTVTAANGCTSTDAVVVNVNTTLPTANAGPAQTTTCTTTSVTIGTASVSGNSYSWSPAAGLSATNVAQPVANPTATTTYTVTVTGSNGCTATSAVTVTVNKTPPTADAGADKNLNCTTTSTIIGTAAVAGNSYSWSPSTGLSATNIAQPTANPTATTTYTVTVTAANGCTSTDAVVVNVNTTLPTANAGPAQTTTCTTTTVTIGTASVSGNSYSWSPSAGLSATNVAQPVANPAATTTYTVTVTGSNGCTATSAVTVTVNKTPPTADAGADKNLNCTTTSTIIGTAAVPGTGNTYSWSPSTGLSATNIAQPTANPTATTTYTVTVAATNGCTSTDAVVVNVNTTLPTANAGPAQTTTCTTTSVTIGTASVSGNSYSWSPSAGLSATNVAQPVANPAATTTYTVTVTGSNGCTATSAVTVTVNKTPPTADAGADKNLNCTTTSTTIGTAAVAGNSYSWSPATGLSATNIAQPTANPTATTTYTVTVTAANGCTSTDAVVVNVNTTLPTANAGPAQTTTCTTTSVTIGTASVSGNSYSWSPSAGLSATNVAQPVANPTATTTYTVTVTGSNGCTATSAVTVTVNKTPPTADAGADKNLNCTTTSTIIGTAAVAGNSYSWSPSTGLSATNIAQPTANPTATTTYTVTVTAANGCTSTDAVVVVVDNNPPTSGITGPNTVCATESVVLQASPTNSQFTYSWSATGNPTISNPSNSNVTFTWGSALQNTTQTVTLIVTTNANGCSSTYTHSVNVTTEVFANAGPDKTICQGGATLIGATPSGPSGANYFWSPNYFINSTSAANPTVNPPVTTTYTLTTTLNGCVRTDIVVVNVNVLLGPGAEAGNSISTCANQSVTLGGNPTTTAIGASFVWSPTAGLNNSTVANPTLTTSTSGWYKVRVTANTGCYNEDSVYVTINPCVNINGNVFVDNNGPANVDGTPTNTANSQLYANLTNNAGTVIATMPVNSNGTFQFNFLTPNSTYSVVLSPIQGTVGSAAPSTNLPTGWSNVSEDCCDNTGNDGNTNGVLTVPVALTDVFNANFGITQPLSVGNLVWNDINKDGLKDAGENGIAGATVYIYADANTDGTPDGAALQNTTTNTNGLYIFNGLTPGSYVIGVVPPSPIAGNPFQSSPVNETNANLDGDNNDNGLNTAAGQTYSGTITLAAGSEPTGETPNNGSAPDANSNLTVDFGFYQPVSIAGNVFIDNNGPTNVDGTPTNNAGTTPLFANLIGSNGNVVAVVPVNANGTFQFNDVQPNTTYNVVLSPVQGTVGSPAPTTTLPTGWSNVSEDCCDNTGNDGNTNGNLIVVVGVTDVTNANFGITQPLSVGNLVWNDINKDGQKDAGENGIAGATVYIYADANTDGTPDGAALQNTTTNANGLYIFNGLTPGNYVIGVVPPVPGSGAGYTSTPINEGNPNDNVDNNDNGVNTVSGQTYSGSIALAAGTEPTGETPNNGSAPDINSNLTIDFGFYQAINLSGTLFIDNDGNAVIDGTPTGSAGTTQMYVNLVNATTGLVVGSMPLNTDGTYQFNDIQPNTNYIVVLSQTQATVGNPAPGTILPGDWVNVGEDCCDNTGNDGTVNGIVPVSVLNSSVTNANFGITQKLSLGNLVWNDENNNGVRDGNETPIENAVVKLYADANNDCIADGNAIDSRNTDANGLYSFNELMPGYYIVGVTPPTVTGGTYQSSTTGEEANPNLNGDNNDNGSVQGGSEVRSCAVLLIGGTEPTGETPNNGGSEDGNSNLTVDFGFYVCPDNFVFTPVDVCPGTFVDLSTLEPAGYTGGVWTSNGNVITNLIVNIGTYVYTFTKGTCTATGTQVLNNQIPDYAPTIAITPSIVYGNKPVRVVVTINELYNKSSCTPVYVFIPRLEPRYSFTWDPTATQFGTGAAGSVQNTEWQYFTSNPNFYIWKYVGAPTFPAGGQSKFGYVGVYDPSNTDGETTFSVQIFQGSGNENNLVNNTDSELLLYYRQ
jgi:hypothetical protein